MFIPQGRAIYENLATSYVLIDSLVEDLCEGGFTGIVEVVLRDSDCHIVVNRGKVVAVNEQKGDGACVPAALDRIARMSRQERGRVSVYAYTADTTAAVSGRMTAEAVYTKLSTEFTDPERMIRKFRREQDREWFVEVRIEDGPTGLIYLTQGKCLVVSSKAGAPRGHNASLEEGDNPALSELMEECKRAGGSFDVYCRLPVPETTETTEIAAEPVVPVIDQVLLAEPESDAVSVETQLRELLASLRIDDESHAGVPDQEAGLAAAASANGLAQDVGRTQRSAPAEAGEDFSIHPMKAGLHSPSIGEAGNRRPEDESDWLGSAQETTGETALTTLQDRNSARMEDVKRLMA
ncbi:MAG TPA: hypothetical protein VFV34_16730, partial [Blastocatellia bacterium]|nr:hypothetical protein [Blastocatellia bacterium]